VADLAVDARGDVWVRCGGDGVSRLAGGVAENYGTANSALPIGEVEMVCPEPAGMGLAGDQVWFVTVDGLTRFNAERGSGSTLAGSTARRPI